MVSLCVWRSQTQDASLVQSVVVSSSEKSEVTVACCNSVLQLSMMTGSLLVLPGCGQLLGEFVRKLC